MMRRGLAFSLVLGLISTARAQVDVTFTLTPVQPALGYAPMTPVSVDVFLTQSTGTPKSVRFAQIDVRNTHASLLSSLTYPTAPGAGAQPFWDFTSNANCTAGTSANCGLNHFIEPIPGGSRVDIGAIAYKGLLVNTNEQLDLASGVALKVGRINLMTPALAGDYTLDVINTTISNLDPDVGGEVRYGFALAGQEATDPLARFRNGSGLTGGTVVIKVAGGGECTLNAATADRGHNQTLSQNRRNKVILTFDGCPGGVLPGVPPAGTALTIRKMLAGPAFDVDIRSGFTITTNANQLIIQDTAVNPNPPALQNLMWYSVHSTGWAGVADFCLDYRVRFGDADNTGIVNFGDLGNINVSVGQAQNDANRWRNIDAANALITFGDIGLANTFISPLPLNKPAGHAVACTP